MACTQDILLFNYSNILGRILHEVSPSTRDPKKLHFRCSTNTWQLPLCNYEALSFLAPP
ncbi:hypothetical protein PIECOFPK_00999 [Mycovorax composti]|uniref:Uncharacterized protein n=1 Tax=Mycovorax composti TaxID=2962693 RepID=A0ABZ2EID3_9BACT